MPENTGLVPDTGRFGVLDIFRFCYFAISVPRIRHPLDLRRQYPQVQPQLGRLQARHRFGRKWRRSLFLPVQIAQIAPPKILHWCLELV
ncbi:hypothetical protein E1A91_A12G082200v1 [Gossypium mustelinum]|uniref:Uncharacterized protein n=4 Tax=Gossypium TaxID=3633 RepID=A0A5J5T7J1_GOSBA|nr:hypothetical protein ES319_A12G081500v1 [Gossypium barbadense]TYG89275.1 hypothetical protein ES288_A12G086800v1 [Gossypium darwinii]TYH95177.1 hypothetical protein ES332_A12G088900v1 [Gossypium tomentosum]TYJ04292.1 hypothetical protein E1A91_A12G082200v1 [Gossypium mustelinum]